MTTIAPTKLTPPYAGPSPITCLSNAGLNRARASSEPGVWEANFGQSQETDRDAIVFLNGPLQNGQATSYAQSLGPVEIAAAGGEWVASASLPSHLNAAVNSVAACMAAGSA